MEKLYSEPSLPLCAKTTLTISQPIISHSLSLSPCPSVPTNTRPRRPCFLTRYNSSLHIEPLLISPFNTKIMQLITAIPYSSHCCNRLHPRRTHPRRHNKRSSSYATKLIISAASRGDAYGHDRDYHGKWVDESMVVLRKRIHEMKITEANCETPDEWMEWEKRYYCERYTSDVCEAVGVLQSLLINTRPSFALGMAAIIALSIPLSAGVIIFRLVEATMWLAAGIHL